ncbi:MAG: MFS transporter, partial [Cyclobacteriaceae bacterium]|nr:MFS transporter [Cyclobacteriaceae bacterium]
FHGLWSLAGFTGAGIGAAMIYLDILPKFHYLFIAIIVLMVILLSQRFLVNEERTEGGNGLVLRKPDDLLLRIGLIAFLGMLCEGCMFDWSGVYFKKVVEISPELVALGYVTFMGAMASARFISDRLNNRFGRIVILRISGILIFLGLILAVSFPTPTSATFGFLLVGLGVASIIPISYSVAGRSKLYSPGVSLAMVSTISFFGFLIGPPLIGYIAEILNLKVSFTLIAISGLGIAALTSFRTDVFQTADMKIKP